MFRHLSLVLVLLALALNRVQADDRRIRLDPDTGLPMLAAPPLQTLPERPARRFDRTRAEMPARQLPDGAWIAPWPGQAEIRARILPDGSLQLEEALR